MKIDFLIIGQGLAGSLLACEFILAGKSFFVIDDPSRPKASVVAAGVINPVVFKRLTKSWLVDDLFPQLERTYSDLEKLLGEKLFYQLQIKKVLGKGEGDFWKKKYLENQLQAYLEPESVSPAYPFVEAEFGIGTVQKAARVDLKLLVEKMKAYLIGKQLLKLEKFDFNQLEMANDQVNYQGISARKIIFCEGHAVSENPFFKDIQFKHTKGEILRIKTANYDSRFILNKELFLMPEGERFYKLGATYDWNDLSPEITDNARAGLQEKLAKIFTDEYQVVGQLAGIRPTTHDRRPVAGLHPKYQQVGIFNGLGAKGAMTGPWVARQLANFLNGKNLQLLAEISIDRYFH